MIESVAKYAPDLFANVQSLYELPSSLEFGKFAISSEERIQQGDPLGPLLFSLCMVEVLNPTKCEFTSAYLDDVTLGDSIDILSIEVSLLEQRALNIGLKLNFSKCEIVGLPLSSHPKWLSSGLVIPE